MLSFRGFVMISLGKVYQLHFPYIFSGMAGASPPVFVDRNPLILLLDVQLSNHFDAIFLQ